MTQEEKSLWLKDLCARVPYHPKGHVVNAHTGAQCDEWLTCATFLMFTSITNNCRLYLRPMSSMTEEEKRHISKMVCLGTYGDGVVYDMSYPVYTPYYVMEDCLNYLRSIHVDYSGLIEKGLALKAPEGMYNLNNE